MMSSAISLMVHISFLLSIGMIVIVLRKCRPSQVRTAFLFTIGIMAIWNIGTLLELDFRIATGVTYMLFIDICYIGICLVPVAILYLGKVILHPEWKPRPVHALFLVIPFMSIVMVFTNSLHLLFFKHFSLSSSEAVYGSYFYFHSLYSYGCIVVGIVLMIIASTRNYGIFSMQSLFVILGVIVTLVPNMLYSFGVVDLPFSISTAAFTVTILCFSVAFLKFRFITSLPITLRQVVDLISDGYLLVDAHFCILAYNQALLNLLPKQINIALGTEIRTFIERYLLNTSYDRFLELHARSVTQRKTASLEWNIMGDTYVDVEITPVMHHNTHIGSIILLKDITQSKLLIEATNAANQAKSDFLSHMSHEIRTPLNAIIGMINIGMKTDDIEKKNYCFDRADGASKQLLGIINDILDMSKIEANKFELSYSKFNFEKMLMNITNVVNVRVEEKQHNFIVNLGKNVPAHIEGDELRLSQIITNLLTNAIKFTPEKGTIILTVEKIEEINDDVVLRIEVSDTGIGLSKEQQERLFTPFNQADNSISRKFGGTGLGLAISKRIVELMDGKIWIESEPGKGAKFIFTLKAKKLAISPRTKLSEHIKPEDLHILAVDSSAETREYFVHAMEALKLFCDVASNGKEALDMIKKAGDKPYNIFFVDRQMPEMDGIELAKKIMTIDSKSSVIIMSSVTSWNLIEKEAVAAGVKHFISRPLFPSMLIDAVNICAGEELNESVESIQHKTAESRRYFYDHTLLIAEDVEVNREIIGAIFKETDVFADYAENGKIALSMFYEHPEKYSLILMDVNMPEMDGYEATRQIRSLDLTQAKNIPIIAMTANVFREDIEKCLASGMNGHIGKPIDLDALFTVLDKYLTHSKEEH